VQFFHHKRWRLTDSHRWNPERPVVRYSTELKGHGAGIEKVAFNPVKDAELCSVSSDGVVKFWDVRTKAVINEIRGLGEAFTLAWSPDGESLLVGNKVRLPLSLGVLRLRRVFARTSPQPNVTLGNTANSP